MPDPCAQKSVQWNHFLADKALLRQCAVQRQFQRAHDACGGTQLDSRAVFVSQDIAVNASEPGDLFEASLAQTRGRGKHDNHVFARMCHGAFQYLA